MTQRSVDSALSRNAQLLWILALGAVVASTACSRQSQHADLKSVRKVTIGIQVSPAMTLVMVAKDEGFFSQQGLDVDLKEFTAGKFALQAFLGGSIDFAVSGDVPVCLAALQGNQIRVVAQVVDKTVNEVRVVALKDRGTKSASDPGSYFRSQKRKLATSFGGGPEFFPTISSGITRLSPTRLRFSVNDPRICLPPLRPTA